MEEGELTEIVQAVAKTAQSAVERWNAQQADFARTTASYADAASAKIAADLAKRMEPYQKALNSHYQRLAESATGISAGRFTRADVDTLVGGQYKALEPQYEIIGILKGMLDGQVGARIQAEKAAESREIKEDWKYWLALGVAIAIGLLSIAVQVVVWWLGR